MWSLAFTAAHADEHQEWCWLTEHWSHPCLHTAYFVAGIVLRYCPLGIFINSQWASLNKHYVLFNNSGTVRIAIPWKTILWSTGVHFPLACWNKFPKSLDSKPCKSKTIIIFTIIFIIITFITHQLTVLVGRVLPMPTLWCWQGCMVL